MHLTTRWLSRLGIPGLICAALAAGCDPVTAGDDAGLAGADADPNAPDADPAAPDADPSAPDAATTGLVAVTVHDDSGRPELFASVVFHDADGRVVQKLTTDPQGRASSVIDRGDLVSVVRTTSENRRQVVTYVGVAPGDELRTGPPRLEVQTGPYGTLSVSGAAYPGVSYVEVDTGCQDGTPADESGAASILLFDGCHDPAGTVPLYLEARAGFTPVAYAVRPALPGGGVGAVPIAASEWRTDFASAVLTIANTPASVYVRPHVFVDQAPGLEAFTFHPQVAGNPQPGEPVNATVVVPRGLGTSHAWSFETLVYSGSDQSFRLVTRRQGGALPAALALDAGRFLPELTARATVGSGDAARPRLTWASAGDLGSTDGGVVYTSWYDPAADAVVEWILVVPPGTTSIQLPELPASLAAWRPGVDAVPDAPKVLFVEASALGGYDAFRALPGRYFFYQTGRSLLRLLPPGEGELRVTSIDIAGS